MSSKNNSVYRTYGFWMSLTAAILLVVQTILSRLGIEIDAPFVQEVISGILAVLVILGIIIKPKTSDEADLGIQIKERQNDSDIGKKE
jgi:uncharacterized membrane protein